MKEWEEDVLGQYDIDAANTKRVRGGTLCEGKQGVYLLTETRLSESRLNMLEELYKYLLSEDFNEIDYLIKNKEERLFCELEDGSKYILKRWFAGRECDVKRENELLSATKNLTRLHKAMSSSSITTYQGKDIQQEFFRHNRELKKVRSFIRGKVDKGKFEQAFLANFDVMYQWAEETLIRLTESNYKKIPRTLTHGDYNYHNILMLHDSMATTNFEHFEENIQVTDLYYFLRKTMEKHGWDIRLGEKMLNYYQRFHSVTKDEMEYVGILMSYPEKFWKAANAYSRVKKTWIPAKNLEKLELVTKQLENKKLFLDKVLDFRL